MSHQGETEDRCESPSSPILCTNNCGFFANPECGGLCSICFKDTLSKQKAQQNAPPQEPPASTKQPIVVPLSPTVLKDSPLESTEHVAASPVKRTRHLRCTKCSKRLGLTGFTCRCGEQFCNVHRYPQEHQCAFDRKAAERNKLKDENPVVLSDKLERV